MAKTQAEWVKIIQAQMFDKLRECQLTLISEGLSSYAADGVLAHAFSNAFSELPRDRQ